MIPAKLVQNTDLISEVVGYKRTSKSGIPGELIVLPAKPDAKVRFYLFSPTDTDQISVVVSAKKDQFPSQVDVDPSSIFSLTVVNVAIRITSDISRFVATQDLIYEARVNALRTVLKALPG